jgi:sugar lactone lactonase YvrE
MNLLARLLPALFLVHTLLPQVAMAQSVVNLGGYYTNPCCLALDQQGNVYVSSGADHFVSKVSPADGYLTQAALASNLGLPYATVIDHNGNLFIGNLHGGVIYEASAASGYATLKLVSTGLIGFPIAFAIDASDNLYVADVDTEAIYELSAANGYSSARMIASGFTGLYALALDSSGNLFAGDVVQQAVYKIAAVGGVIPDAPAITSIPGASANPDGLVVDSSDNLFVTDQSQIFELSAADQYSTRTALPSRFSFLTGLAIDGAGNLYVSDNGGDVRELLASTGYSQNQAVSLSTNDVISISADSKGDVFVADHQSAQVVEIPVGTGPSIGTTIFSGLDPRGLATDSQQNVFVADSGHGAVLELLAADGYSSAQTIASGLTQPSGLAIDSAGNLFVSDSRDGSVKEIFAAGGYKTVKALGVTFSEPSGLAIDSAGNIFVADLGGSLPGSISEITAQSGYTVVNTLITDNNGPQAVAVDADGNVFFAEAKVSGIQEITKNSGYKTVTALDVPPGDYLGLLIDQHGNIFAAVFNNLEYSVPFDGGLIEILAGPPSIAASILPSARATQPGKTTTVFATMVNPGQAPLENCRVALPTIKAYGLQLDYQTTDPTTNALTGSPNTPVTIPPAPGAQSFLLALNFLYPIGASRPPVSETVGLAFVCDGVPPAPTFPGVSTLGLTVAGTPIPDIVALAATPTNNGVVSIPVGGAAAFAVASTNLGVTDTISVTVNTGSAQLPLTATLCQTDPQNGQCLAPPTATVSLSYGAGQTPTFSMFLQASGPIPFAPSTSRAFVEFTASPGAIEVGATSVAVMTR